MKKIIIFFILIISLFGFEHYQMERKLKGGDYYYYAQTYAYDVLLFDISAYLNDPTGTIHKFTKIIMGANDNKVLAIGSANDYKFYVLKDNYLTKSDIFIQSDDFDYLYYAEIIKNNGMKVYIIYKISDESKKDDERKVKIFQNKICKTYMKNLINNNKAMIYYVIKNTEIYQADVYLIDECK